MSRTPGKASQGANRSSKRSGSDLVAKAKKIRSIKIRDLSSLSKSELVKIDQFFFSRRFIEIPELNPDDPHSALAIKCIIQRALRVKKAIRKANHSSWDILFLNNLSLTDNASQFISEIDSLSRSNFLLIRMKLISELEKILDSEIQRIQKTIKAKNMNTVLVDAISSAHQEIEQDIVILASSQSSTMVEILERNDLETFTVGDAVKALENLHSPSKVLEVLSPSSSIFDSGFVEISTSGIVDADKWEKVTLKFRNKLNQSGQSSKQSTEWFEWQKHYKPSKKMADVFLPDKTKNVIELLVEDYKRKCEDKRLVFIFRGPPGTGKTMTSEAIAHSLGMNVLRIQTGEIESKNLPNIITYAMARARNGRNMLLFEESEHLLWKSFYLEIASPWMKTLFEDFKGVACFTTNYEVPTDFLRRATFSAKLMPPNEKIREKILENEIIHAMSNHQDNVQVNTQEIQGIASQFNIPGGFFSQVLQLAGAMTQDSHVNATNLKNAFNLVESQLLEGKTNSGPRDPNIRIEELKLDSESELKILKFIRYCERSLNENDGQVLGPKTILFSGPPGTGKTMAAEAIAKSLGKKIFRVSPSYLLGKYVGETEKKIRELFNTAKTEGYVVFLDEAEGLLIDRHTSAASWERTQADEFLQQIENYNGILIAATNWTSMIDHAYARRFVFHISFKVPDSKLRLQIWQKFRSNLPEGVELSELAERFELSGGEIRNVAIKAKAYDLQTQVQVCQLCEDQINERTGIVVKRIGIN